MKCWKATAPVPTDITNGKTGRKWLYKCLLSAVLGNNAAGSNDDKIRTRSHAFKSSCASPSVEPKGESEGSFVAKENINGGIDICGKVPEGVYFDKVENKGFSSRADAKKDAAFGVDDAKLDKYDAALKVFMLDKDMTDFEYKVSDLK
jgi:hypothetical protein